MLILLKIAIAMVSVASLLDGISTSWFLKKGLATEGDPIAIWLFGTDTPSNFVLFSRGGAIIVGECLLAMLAAYMWPASAFLTAFILTAQSAVHVYEAIRNFRL